MGKAKKLGSKNARRHDPLDQQILENKYAKPSTRSKARGKVSEEEEYVDDKLTSKILEQARLQQEELEEQVGLSEPSKAFNSLSLKEEFYNEDEEDEDDNVEHPKIRNDIARDLEEIKISEDDERAFENFMVKDAEKRKTLADILKDKLTEKKTEIYTVYSDAGSVMNEAMEKNMELYKKLAPILKDYRSGKLPKPFKVIPKFNNWEQILYFTEPDKWSAASMLQATRIFSSNLKDKMAQRFYNLILLPRLRDDIAECKTLNVHLYQALKKSLFKPAAFFKGIILPLCEAGNCTLREATIFGSVLAKCSVPILHSSAALLAIADMQYTGANSIFMRVLLEKKYALPLRVVNAVVAHFLRFMDDKREYPLLWHQCLLTFVQIYKNDLSVEQKKSLFKLLTVHFHPHVTPAIRRELQSSANGELPDSMDADVNTSENL